MFLFGEGGGSRRRSSNKTYVNYGDFHSSRDIRRKPLTQRAPIRSKAGRRDRLDGISFETRREAGNVLEGLIELYDEYQEVSIADFYELAGLENLIDHTDNNWGWRDELGDTTVVQVRSGYELDLPDAVRLS
jgi:hypothetical protein